MIIRRRRRHLGQTSQLPVRLFLGLFRHPRGVDLFAQLLHLLLLVGLTEFLLNGLHLFAQVILTLALRHLILNVRLNLGAELQHLHFPCQLPVQAFQPNLELKAFQDFLLFGTGERRKIGGDKIGKPARLIDIHHYGLQVIRQRRRKLHDLLEHRRHAANQRVKVRFLRARGNVRQRLHPGAQERFHLRDFLNGDPLQPFHKDEQTLAGKLDDLVNEGHRPDLKQVNRLGVIHPGIALGDDADVFFFFFEIVDELQGTVPTHRQRQNGVGK